MNDDIGGDLTCKNEKNKNSRAKRGPITLPGLGVSPVIQIEIDIINKLSTDPRSAFLEFWTLSTGWNQWRIDRAERDSRFFHILLKHSSKNNLKT